MPGLHHGDSTKCRSAFQLPTVVFVLALATWSSGADPVPDFTHSRPKSDRQPYPRVPYERPAIPEIRFGNFIPFNPIDNFILQRLKNEKLRPAKLCDDWDFARRASVDLAGVIPTAADMESYFKWKSGERRAKWIEHLLRQPQYADHWTIFWGDLLREQGRIFGAPPDALKGFVHKCLTDNRPFDDWIRELISATGSAEENGAVAFILRDRGDPDVLTVSVSQSMLGIQLKCAQCHDHPYDWWTQQDFRDMAGFWQGTRVRPVGTLPARGPNAPERPLLGIRSNERQANGRFITGAVSEKGRGRDALAELITRRDNPYFARVTVNRLWEKLMGTGLVNPADNFSTLNPPSHSELLDWLALEFIESGYDLKHMLRLMATSRTYQQSTAGTVRRLDGSKHVARPESQTAPGAFFEKMPLRRMTAEQLHDSILAATGHYWKKEGPLTAAITRTYPPQPRDFLAVFGASDRDTLLPRPTSSSIQQSLTMLNGELVNRAVTIHADHPLVAWQQDRGLNTAQMVDALFVQILTRFPTAQERRWALNYLGWGTNEWAWEDLQWALINTREFQFIR